MARLADKIAIFSLCLMVLSSLALAADVDKENPVDLYGPDGLPFTPDDVLIARGGYTNTAMFATAYGEKGDGLDPDADEDKVFRVGVGSWAYDGSSAMKGSNLDRTVCVHMLCTEEDKYSDTGKAKWRPMPAAMPPGADMTRLYEPELFGYCEFPIQLPEEQSSMFGGGKVVDQPWFNGGNNLRVSMLSLGSWEDDGTLSPLDPSVTISTDHFPKVKDIIKEITVEKNHYRGGCLSVLNQDTGESGVAAFGSLTVRGLVVKIDGEVSGLDVSGEVKNSTPYVTVSINVLLGSIDIKVEITKDDKEPPDNVLDGAGELIGSGHIEVGTIWIIDELRKELKPQMPALDDVDKQRITAEWDAGRGIDCLANEVVRAIVRTGQWLPWVPATDAGSLTRSSDDIDLSTTKLDDSRTTKAEDVLQGGQGPINISNSGMDYLVSDTLIYGRDQPNKHNRLLEWFASNWLCLNLTDFQPYSGANGEFAKAQAQWNYYDLICDKKITDPSSGTGPIEMDEGWPPPAYWFGGQGMVLGAQAGLGHQGDSTGPDKPDFDDAVEPGNPHRVLAAVVALTPYATADSSSLYAAYNVLGITLGTAEGWELKYMPNPIGGAKERKIEWPPPNDWPESPTKFFHGCVANGHVDSITDGRFATLWDFEGRHQDDHKYANSSYAPEGESPFGRLFVFDPITERTGMHQVDVWYEPADL